MYNGLSLSPLRHPEYGIRIPGRCTHGRLRHTKSSHSLPALYIYIDIQMYIGIYPHAAQWAALTGRTPACCLYIYVIHDTLVVDKWP